MKKTVEVKCINCGENFQKRKDLIKITNNHYCSIQCKREVIRSRVVKKEFMVCTVCMNELHYSKFGRRYSKEINGRIRNTGRIDINGDGRKFHCKSCDYKIIKNKHENDPSYRLYLLSRRRAKKKGIEFNLTKEFVKKLWDKDDKICPILNQKYQFGINKKNLNPSLDRVDNKKGYIKSNVRFLSFRANSLKGDVEDIEIFKRLYDYMKIRK